MRLFSNRKRPVHRGPYPLERLPRGSASPLKTRVRPSLDRAAGSSAATAAYAPYIELCDELRQGDVIADAAPIPDDLVERANHIKAGLYFLDADMVGVAEGAIVTLIAHSRVHGSSEPGADWIDGTRQINADLRAAELAVITADYIRNLGFDATAHTPNESDVDIEQLALDAGLVEVRGGKLRAPFIKSGFALSAVTTTMELAPDGAIASEGVVSRLKSRGPAWWLGLGGTRAGIRRFNGDHRPLHMGRYPMERIKRVDDTTTLILEDEVKRVPVRAGGFPRAANGDMGPKFAADVKVFAYKTPQAQSYVEQIDAMVPLQDGPVAGDVVPIENAADAVKAMAYHLGGDMVGVCKAPTYAWYSHAKDGTPIEPRHPNAIVILLDQGYETMEGASGDDWVSGAQSMRAYMRGAQIAGVLAEHIRSLGYSARSHTNRDSEVLHIPLVLHAGLGEMSRIGELVLNPFVGPRFKSVVVTTDLPMTADLPIDFGLQDFCNKCTKCARECPCAAIPFGGKIMFNGYETWKPDVEKCTKYRLGNQKGAACGRCMKTCPYNIEGVLAERAVLWSAIKLPFTRKWIAHLDDKVGNGSINTIKKWWWDLEWIEGRATHPAKGTNARDLDLDGGRVAARQKVAIYPPEVQPPGDAIGVPVKLDRPAAVAAGQAAEARGVPPTVG